MIGFSCPLFHLEKWISHSTLIYFWNMISCIEFFLLHWDSPDIFHIKEVKICQVGVCGVSAEITGGTRTWERIIFENAKSHMDSFGIDVLHSGPEIHFYFQTLFTFRLIFVVASLRNVPNRTRYLNTQSPVGGAVWGCYGSCNHAGRNISIELRFDSPHFQFILWFVFIVEDMIPQLLALANGYISK